MTLTLERSTVDVYESLQSVNGEIADRIEAMVDVIETDLAHSDVARSEVAKITNKLRDAAEKRRADRFNIVVIGEFKRGKSTLLNAMLGMDVLPSKAPPCTALITVIVYGDEPGARVIFKDGTPDEQLSIEEFREKYELKVADAAVASAEAEDRFSHISHAEIRYPIELCRNGVELVDCPGLGEHRSRTQRVRQYLHRADAVIFVLDAMQLLTDEERHFLEVVLKQMRLRNLFFVVNKWNLVADGCLRPQDVLKNYTELNDRINGHLSSFCYIDGCDRREDRIFRVNAFGALKAKVTGNVELLADSKVPEVESSLQRFLMDDRVQARNNALASQLDGIRTEISRCVATQSRLSDNSVDEIEAKRAKVEPKLQRMRAIREHANNVIRDASTVLVGRLQNSLADYLGRLEQQLPDDLVDSEHFDLSQFEKLSTVWDAFVDKAKFWSKEKRLQKKCEEVLKPQIARYIEFHLAQWQSSIEGEGETMMRQVRTQLESDAREFIEALEQAEDIIDVKRTQIDIGQLVEQWMKGWQPKQPGAMADPVIDTGGLLADLTPLLVGIAADILVHAAIGHLVPLLGMIVSGWMMKGRLRKRKEKIRAEIASGIGNEMRKLANQCSHQLEEQGQQQFDEFRERVTGVIDEQISLFDATLKEILDSKRNAEESADDVRTRLEFVRTEVDDGVKEICRRMAIG